ncbi:MAG: tRNA preQ1(34) S-adenosylmethionine ribosyltransferase-isomerase QueA [Thermoplasmata archaeon]|nr:MAG: tRNA preQ1(34) S-adenosylmethionine ribosyltransferase-isomerase QueA [Thermoplasmata archaeon]
MLEELNYNLPRERIAQEPTLPRDHCNLLVLKNDEIEHKKFYQVVEYLDKGDVIVMNDSRVMKVRLTGRKETGGKLDILIIGKKGENYECLIKGKYREGMKFFLDSYECRILQKNEGRCIVSIPLSFDEIEKIGKMPTPPYIKREVENEEWYQTVFAREKGSIAAPTAGLHFTEELMKKIRAKGVEIVFITLHVGLATFMPVERIKEEKEYYCISQEAAEKINGAEGKVIAVGTTTVKALESSSRNGKVIASSGWSNLFISPGYKFQSPINGMITNFHMPKSSPLLLTTAFGGIKRVMKAYEEALKRDYKFLSFGDAMLILKCSK